MSRITIVYRKIILCFVLVMAVCCAFFTVGCKNKTADTTSDPELAAEGFPGSQSARLLQPSGRKCGKG